MGKSEVRRVLMTADTVGGVWTYALELSRGLAARGVEVLLATMGGAAKPEQRAAARAIPNLRLEESAYRLEWMDAPWADVDTAGQWLQSLAGDFQPHLMHLNGYAHAALEWPAPTIVVAHSDVLTWWKSVKGEAAPVAWSEYRTRVEAGLRAADLVVAPSHAMADELSKSYELREPAKVVYNGCDPTLYRVEPKEGFIFAAGRLWDEAKNLAALQAVAPDLAWPAYVAGDERHPSGRDVGGWSPTKTLGILTPEALRHWYGRAGIYAFPAKYEPFGLSVLEAALSGCALVLGDIPTLREIWGDAAWYAEPTEPNSLRKALEALIANSSLRESLAEKARVRAQRYTAERMTDGYLELYRQTVRVNDAELVY